MTPPPILNLKALGLWVFFLICCSTFSFLLNVGLRLTLEYLTISLSSESPSFTLIYSPSSGSKWSLTCTAVHTLIQDTLAWNLHQEDFRYRVKLSSFVRWQRRTIGSDTTCWENPRGKYQGDLIRMRTEPTHIREWHQPKTLRHWVCGSSYVAQRSHFYPLWDLDSHLNT